MAKKTGSFKGLGARYGIKPRIQFTKVHKTLKAKRKCPECGSLKFGRQDIGTVSYTHLTLPTKRIV